MFFIKKPLLLSLLSGVLLTLSWPVSGFSFLIFVGLIPLFFSDHIISKDNKKRKRIRLFANAFLSFFIWNLGTTWWIVNSSVFGMFFAVICNTLFYTILMMLFNWSKKRLPLRTAYIFLVTLWISFEKFHMQWEFSWPWLNLGNVFSEDIHWIQWYEYTGIFGGSLWILIINIGVFEVLKNHPPNFKNSKFVTKISPWLIGIAFPIIISLIIYKSEEKGESRIEVLLLQPNIDPYEEKYERNNRYFFDLMIQMVSKQITGKTRYIFTPETYFASGLGEPLDDFYNCQLYRDLDSLLQQNPQIQLVSGIQSFNIYKSEKKPSSTANEMKKGYWIDFYNSALKMQSNSQHEFYHKSKLVVGVENMPYKSFFKPILGQFLIDLGGTVSSRVTQKERTVFKHKTENLKVGPIICYESIYGSFVTEYIRKGADFLAIITNDAWWGNTAGHRQLLSYSRLRAIENRRSIVRSANTGISAIINKKGELIDKLPYNHKGLLRGYFSTAKEITFYTQYGDYIARLSCLIMILYFLLALSGRLKRNSSKK